MLKTTQLNIVQESSAFWRVIFDNPPLNLLDPDTIGELQQLAAAIEAADALKVVVFESANPDYFIAHYDMSRAAETPSASVPGSLHPWADFTMRLADAPVVSIAAVKGRARGVGNEFALACDLRFASLERAFFCQPEVAVGIVPGGGAVERLPLLVGRARAIEILLGSDDIDAATAERYGLVNRAIPDVDFKQFRCHLRATDCIVRQAGPGGGEGIAQSNRSADTRGFGVELGDVPAIAVMGRREGQDHSVDQGRPVQAGRFRVAAGPSSWRPHGFGTKQWLIE